MPKFVFGGKGKINVDIVLPKLTIILIKKKK